MKSALVVHLSESDLHALEWAWWQDVNRSRQTPAFGVWLENLLWEQANAIRHGLGAHTAWDAAMQQQESLRATRRLPLGPRATLRNGR